MASRFQDLVTRLIANDQASKVIEHVADDLDKLEKKGDTEVTISADDKASKDIATLDKRLEGLSAADKKIVVRAQLTESQRDVDRLLKSLARVDQMDDEQVKIKVDALGNAKRDLDAIQKEADRLDREEVDIAVDVDNQTQGKFAQLKTDLAGAETGMDKLRVLGGTAFTNLSSFAIPALATAGVAVGAFVKSAVTDFETLGIEVGKMRDTLGIPAEAASRLKEVADDIGVPVGALTTAIQKMNKQAAASPQVFANMGASIVRSDDGATDVMETFLSVIDALDNIPDAAQRAAAGQQIFGKGWGQISELIVEGADQMRTAMAEVGGEKIVDDSDIAQAREMRDTMDELADKIDDAKLAAAKGLAPTLIELANLAADILGPVAKVADRMAEARKAQEEDPGKRSFLQGFIDTALTTFPTMARQVQQHFDDLKDGLGEITHGSVAPDWVPQLGKDVAETGISVAIATGQVKAFKDELEKTAQLRSIRNTEAARDLLEEGQSAQDAAANYGALQKSLELKQAAEERAKDATQDHIDALQEEADLAAETSDAFQSMADINRQIADQQARVAELGKDETATTQDRVDAAIQLADLQTQQFEAMKQAAGATATATEKLDRQNNMLLDQAETLSGPARDALVTYIEDLNGIPADKRTEIESLIDQGKFDEAQAKITELSANRQATVTYDADTKEADDARERLAEPIDATVFFHAGGQLVQGAREMGGYVPRRELAIVGEKGPELVELPGGSRVYPAHQTRALTSGSGPTALAAAAAAVTYKVNVILQAGTIGAPFDVANAVEDAMRRVARLMPKHP